ncbi:MAG TPA: MAPEG family protein [Methylocella sp.]|nr:MAPEG family protein [Methylocella sp.]
MPVTALYASLLTPFFIALALRVISMRASAKVAFGDGGDRELLRRTRVHANFAEYVPLAPAPFEVEPKSWGQSENYRP